MLPLRLSSFSLVALLTCLSVPASAGEGGGDDIEIIQFLASTGADANGTCRARWKQDENSTQFDVELEDMDTGDYELWVAGVNQGTVTVLALGEGELEFAVPQDGAKPLLDFEVLDQVLEIRQGATVFFSDTFDGTGTGGGGGGGGDATKTEVFMVAVGPDLNAQGRLRYEAQSSKLKFSVEVEDLDAGTYELLVAGATVGEISPDGDETEIEFQDPVESGKVLLNFDPLGAQVDVAAGGVVYLTAVMPASDTETGSKAPKTGKKGAKDEGKKKGDALLVFLANSGVIAGAHGTAKLSQSGETEFEVEIEDLPDGDYSLEVDGVEQSALTVAGGNGQLNFSTSPGLGVALLDFEVQGQLVAVTNGVDTVLSVVFPLSVQAALDTFKKEIHALGHVKMNLIPTGVDLDARALLDFKDKSAHDTLVIKVFDLAPGSYDVVVNGTPIDDALLVTAPDGKAKVTFDTQPKGSQLLLDFTVAGATVQVTPADDNPSVLLQVVVE